jgi:peroxiredoxin
MNAKRAQGLAASLAENTRKVISRRGAEQAKVLFDGQIDPSTAAMSNRINSIGTGDKAPLFDSPTIDGDQWSLKKGLSEGAYDSVVLVFYRKWVLPVPGTFVIDRQGEIVYAHVDPDYRNRPEPSEIVSVCRSMKR